LSDSFDTRLAAISARLLEEPPIQMVARETAAVAVTLARSPLGGDLLLIRRAVREGDPWSGDVAFPGGRAETGDGSFRETAVREAREEVGAELASHSRFLGYMPQFQARRRGIWVVPCVFLTGGPLALRDGAEVSEHVWIALGEFLDPGARSTFTLEFAGEGRSFPCFDVRGYRVWGLTERIISSLADAIADGGS
jgi:8-oxo-dGTP pyrophosphatase MutT (NUDIX family)